MVFLWELFNRLNHQGIDGLVSCPRFRPGTHWYSQALRSGGAALCVFVLHVLLVVIDDSIDDPLILVGPREKSCDVLSCDDELVYASYQQQKCKTGDKEVADTGRHLCRMDAGGQHNDGDTTASYEVYFFAS